MPSPVRRARGVPPNALCPASGLRGARGGGESDENGGASRRGGGGRGGGQSGGGLGEGEFGGAVLDVRAEGLSNSLTRARTPCCEAQVRSNSRWRRRTFGWCRVRRSKG